MISLRKSRGAATLVATVAAMVAGCGGLEGRMRQDAGSSPGCTGVCSEDGGIETDAGSQPDGGGAQADGGALAPPVVMTISEARKSTVDGGVRVQLQGVVVHTVDSVDRRLQNAESQSRAWFWVVDPARPTQGLWVHKDWTDLPAGFVPEPGQRLDLTGWMRVESGLEQLTGYRTHLANQSAFSGPAGKLELFLLGTLSVPADNPAPSTFGNADGGWARPNPELLGTRVHVPGSLAMTNPTPRAFQRVSAHPNDPVFYGFEVTGGILVSSRDTSGTSPTDGGPARCDWQALVRNDGGTVLFPGGIRGVWDTYTFVPCEDGGTDPLCLPASSGGRVPGTDLPDGGFGSSFTHVLYPRSCDEDLVGEWDAGR